MSYKLGILDQSPIFPGIVAFDALQQTIQLAQKAEEWGYIVSGYRNIIIWNKWQGLHRKY